ncbi:MAG: hypothetical protein JNM52_07645 [Betaproteobacteria bacterium]|nr:hypothetical protein [Betaproteobacteria bacterium]
MSEFPYSLWLTNANAGYTTCHPAAASLNLNSKMRVNNNGKPAIATAWDKLDKTYQLTAYELSIG